MSESPRKQTPVSSLSDKPLPSPPVAQVTTDLLGEPRSLIDASEKPLRRASPKSPRKEEEWPVLFPEKPTTPDAIRQALHQTTPEPVRVTSNGQERYPRLSGSQSADILEQEPFTRLPSTVQIQRKQISAISTRGLNATVAAVNGPVKDAGKPTASDGTNQSESAPREPKNAHRLSAGVAAVEKSSAEAKTIKEPRQTRTSSLRARISAGQVIKDSPNKVLGFTDFTAEKVPSTKTSKEDLSSAAESSTGSSSSFGKAFTKKPSKEFLAGTRAPAQFVAGSRRPAPRRPGSRNSLRIDSRASSPTFLEPSRPAPPIPTVKANEPPRKSSIPIFRNGVSAIADSSDPRRPSIDLSSSTRLSNAGGSARHEKLILEDKPNVSTKDTGNDVFATTADSDHAAVLESIEESPKSTFRSKRLSSLSPTFGPMLKISSSADRLIMGTGAVNKENRPLTKKRSKDLFRAAVTNEHRNVAISKTPNHESTKSKDRPISSQGLSENQQRHDAVATAHENTKINNADLSSVSSNNRLEAGLTKLSKEDHIDDNRSSGTDETFVTVAEQRKSLSRGIQEQDQQPSRESFHSANPESSISPVKNSATPMSDAVPVVAAFLPVALQEHVHNSRGTSETIPNDELKERRGGYVAIRIDTNTGNDSDQSAPATPEANSGDGKETPSSIFPPRSSSRMQHQDHTVNGSAKASPTSSTERATLPIQKGISVYDFAKTDSSVANSFSRPVGVGGDTSRGEITSQTSLTDKLSKRESTARISQQSQLSVSKGLMSNFRGLFHKRTSDASETPKLRSNRKGSKRPTVNSHGSPFPSMSDIHPVHRPTQASLNRINGTAQRSSGHSLTAGTLGTPTFNSPLPTEISTTTSLAMQILESARKEHSSPKKERLLSLGKIMVDSITQARDAEKAMEEAKQAARTAEVAYARCKKSVGDVARLVREWKDDSDPL